VRSLLLALALAALVPAGAHAAAGMELGVQDDAVLLDHAYSDAGLALDRAAELGAERVRVNLRWDRAMPRRQARLKHAPADVEWEFGPLERLLADASARGLRMQVTLTGPAPRWATGPRRWSSNRAPRPVHFGRFAGAVARHFAGRIDRYSTWNEPNWHSRLQPHRGAPGRYRALHLRAYSAIKRADPAAQVLIGELMPGANRSKSTPALAFLRRLACVDRAYRRTRRCPPLLADGFALHPYNFARRPRAARSPNPDIVEMGSLSRLTRALDVLAVRGALRTPTGVPMPLYLTEFGYFTKGPIALGPRRHARWMAEAWRIAARNPRVHQLLQYGLVDPWPAAITWRTALLRRDGAPRQAFYALQRLAR
jgi:hypothetical protein